MFVYNIDRAAASSKRRRCVGRQAGSWETSLTTSHRAAPHAAQTYGDDSQLTTNT